jgi:hypothetical protein
LKLVSGDVASGSAEKKAKFGSDLVSTTRYSCGLAKEKKKSDRWTCLQTTPALFSFQVQKCSLFGCVYKEEKETQFQRGGRFSTFGSLVCRNLFCLFWVMCFVCYQNSVCVRGYIQLIWTLSVQEYVLSVLGDLLICFETAFW